MFVIGSIYEGGTLRPALREAQLSSKCFFEAIDSVPSLAKQYMLARKADTDVIVDELKEIADNPLIDPQRARNMIEVRKWTASKRNAAVFGDRIDVNVTQIVDIGAALAEAKARSLPISYPIKSVESEVIEVTKPLEFNQAGHEPDSEKDEDETGDAIEKTPVDIFS